MLNGSGPPARRPAVPVVVDGDERDGSVGAAERNVLHGPVADHVHDPTRVALRGLGAREVLLHGGGLAATVRGGAVCPWLAASVAGDVADIASTAAGRRGLPDGAAPATLAVAGASALLSVAVGAAVDR
jgi:hypothetical protein